MKNREALSAAKVLELLGPTTHLSSFYEKIFFPKILGTAPVELKSTGAFEVHLLTCQAHAEMAIWVLKTFYHFSGENVPLVIHDDGSLSENQIRTFDFHFPGVTIIRNRQPLTDNKFKEWLQPYPNLDYWRWIADSPIARRLLDFKFYSKSEYIISLDSDILFFRNPRQINTAIHSRSAFISTDYINAYYPKIEEITAIFGERPITFANTGCWGMQRSSIDLAFLDQCLGKLSDADPFFHWGHNHIEQSLMSILLKQRVPHEMLNPVQYGISHKMLSQDAVYHHFPNDKSRPFYYKIGLRLLDRMGILERLKYKNI